MINHAESFLQKLDTLPEFLECSHLIELGLYRHKNRVYLARIEGTGPSYVKISSKKYIYPKAAVREFILKRFHDGSVPREQQEGNQ